MHMAIRQNPDDLGEKILETEIHLLEAIGETIDRSDCMILRSEMFPRYYFGNLLVIKDWRNMDVAYWQHLYRQHFNPERYEHEAYILTDVEEAKELTEGFRNAGYDVATGVWLATESLPHYAVPEGFWIQKVETEEDWKLLRILQNEEGEKDMVEDLSWLDKPSSLFEKERYTSAKCEITWFLLRKEGDDFACSGLGIFKHLGLGRLQSVVTPPRHRGNGYASVILSHAVDFAHRHLGVKQVVLGTELDNPAVKLYTRLGFRPVTRTMEYTKFPHQRAV